MGVPGSSKLKLALGTICWIAGSILVGGLLVLGIVLSGGIPVEEQNRLPFNMFNLGVIRVHLLLSVLPCLVAIAVGGGLGYLGATAVTKLYLGVPALRRWDMLIPWRAVTVILALFVLHSHFFVRYFGFGLGPSQLNVGLCIFVIAFPWTVHILLEHRIHPLLGVRLLNAARTLTCISVGLVVLANLGGLGIFIENYRRAFQFDLVYRGYAIVAVLDLRK